MDPAALARQNGGSGGLLPGRRGRDGVRSGLGNKFLPEDQVVAQLVADFVGGSGYQKGDKIVTDSHRLRPQRLQLANEFAEPLPDPRRERGVWFTATG
jgi:hypothetical protein